MMVGHAAARHDPTRHGITRLGCDAQNSNLTGGQKKVNESYKKYAHNVGGNNMKQNTWSGTVDDSSGEGDVQVWRSRANTDAVANAHSNMDMS